MNKILILIFISLMSTFCFSQNLDIEDMTDEEIELEAQKDMVAFMQYTAPYRFSSDLKEGDKVEYLDMNTKDKITLEVLSKNDEVLLIKEVFEGNEVYIKLDTNTLELIDLYGYDETGVFQELLLLSDNEIDTRINKMKSIALSSRPEIILKKKLESSNITVNDKNLICITYEPAISNSEMCIEDLIEFKRKNTLIYSIEVPKLLPFFYAIEYLPELSEMNNVDSGFVENNVLKLDSFYK